MHIAIRADASNIIGSGHVMRCLTLADAFVKQNAQVTFITRRHTGHLSELIKKKGYQVIELCHTTSVINVDNDKSWLGCSQRVDARECIDAIYNLTLSGPSIDWLIVDHYSIDQQWHRLLKPYCDKLMVIDDLANRQYYCDLLLDQTLNREKNDYKTCVNESCLLLLGQPYMLLRDEFIINRESALRKRKGITAENRPTNILVSIGGTDIHNISQQVLAALLIIKKQYSHLTTTAVQSSKSPHLSSIKHIISVHDWLTLEVDCLHMSSLMLEADIAIGASGSSAWERCCLGLPTMTIVTAENQLTIDNNLADAGAVINLGWFKTVSTLSIASTLDDMIENLYSYHQLVAKCFNSCDGLGLSRAIKKVVEHV